MRCSKLNVSFLLQPKRCECGNQLRSAPVHMGRKKYQAKHAHHIPLAINVHYDFKKNSQVALCRIFSFIGEVMPGCVKVFCIIKCPWMGSPRTDRMSSDLAKLQRHMWLRWNFYSCRIVKYWLSPNYFYNTLWDVYSRIFHRLYKFLCAPYFFSNTYLTGGTNLPVQSCSVYVAKL